MHGTQVDIQSTPVWWMVMENGRSWKQTGLTQTGKILMKLWTALQTVSEAWEGDTFWICWPKVTSQKRNLPELNDKKLLSYCLSTLRKKKSWGWTGELNRLWHISWSYYWKKKYRNSIPWRTSCYFPHCLSHSFFRCFHPSYSLLVHACFSVSTCVWAKLPWLCTTTKGGDAQTALRGVRISTKAPNLLRLTRW